MTALLWHWMGCDWDGMSDFQRTLEPWWCTKMHPKRSDIRHSLIASQQEDKLGAQFLHHFSNFTEKNIFSIKQCFILTGTSDAPWTTGNNSLY